MKSISTRRCLNELASVLTSGCLTSHEATLEGLSRDQTALLESGMPAASVCPTTVEEVSRVLKIASRHGVPVVPRGAGSGLAGGAIATEECLVLSTMHMNQIVEINTEDMVAVCQPGVITSDLAKAAAAKGMFYAPDPSSFEISSIGGNLATNAGGLRCLKYGPTRNAALALEVVLADGTLVRTGHRSVKGVAGYDLVSLFVGSEGTLGVITEATLRLHPQPGPCMTAMASFPSLQDAGIAVAAIATAGVLPTVMELMDATTIAAVEDWKQIGLDRKAAAVLIVSCDAAQDSAGRGEMDRVVRACQVAGASDLLVATDEFESEGLMGARRAALPALERKGIALLEDVAVPLGRVIPLLAAIESIAEQESVVIGTFGHVGDGNLHPTLICPRGDAAGLVRVRRAAGRILEATLGLGGTLTGEHGVGLLKRDLLPREAGPGAMFVAAAIKKALDPHSILNPGKVLEHGLTV